MSGSFQPCLGTMWRWRSEHFSATSGLSVQRPPRTLPLVSTQASRQQLISAPLMAAQAHFAYAWGRSEASGKYIPGGRSGPVTDARLLHSSGKITLESWSYTAVSKLSAQWTDSRYFRFSGPYALSQPLSSAASAKAPHTTQARTGVHLFNATLQQQRATRSATGHSSQSPFLGHFPELSREIQLCDPHSGNKHVNILIFSSFPFPAHPLTPSSLA